MDNGKFLTELDKRIALVIQENKYSAERAQESREDVKKIFSVLDNLKCQSHTEQLKGVNKHFALLWSFVGIIASIFGVVIWSIK